MNMIIRRVVLFGEDYKIKGEVSFDFGLNIITGDSKTGKSAILEIVDYCLFSSRSTIPKGIITEETRGVAIIFQISDKYIVIGRSLRKTERDKAYFSIETNSLFLKSFNFDYFRGKKKHRIKGNIQDKFEKYLGLSITDTRKDVDEEKEPYGKATIRSVIPFLFQHQNLIANKHSLFCRFDDYYKRKSTVRQTPVFLGWVKGDYYRKYREYEAKSKELKVQLKLEERSSINEKELHVKLFPMIKIYFDLIGEKLEKKISLEDLKILGNNLPLYATSIYTERDIEVKVLELEDKLIPIRNELSVINQQLKKIETNDYDALTYENKLGLINESIDIEPVINKFVCPICNNNVEKIESLVKEVIDSKENLITELNKIDTYVEDSSDQYSFLQEARNKAKREIQSIVSKISFLKEKDKEIESNQSLRDQAMLTKGTIEALVKELLNLTSTDDNNLDITQLKTDINGLKIELNKHNLESKYKEADKFLEKRMNDICEKLDFEEELRPGRLKFNLEKFKFYYLYKGNEKISLSEMGSGANWLACHLSVSIALLHLSCREGNKSTIPSFLFLDQPSQVYFPRKYGETEDGKKEENIEQVKKIFRVLVEELEVIKKDCGFVPQIIVMEHADEEDFSEYVKERWSRDGKKLI